MFFLGHPLKVHKRSAVIRFMFFNRDDIMFFKPCKLRTKHGRTGHIKEPLGMQNVCGELLFIIVLFVFRYPWSYEMCFRWTVKITRYSFAKFV